MNETISTELAPKAIGPYSQAIKSGNLLFLSGVMPINPETSELEESDIVVQASRIMKNVDALLNAAGYSVNDVVKTTCFLANIEDFAKFNEVYADYFVSKPARSCVAVKDLPKKALVEVEVIASK
ncbi:MAG: RidA family protein [Erysipelotrichaceae bacterium]|nr:RidA family protein [Erysipelotrichaceae bacterium]